MDCDCLRLAELGMVIPSHWLQTGSSFLLHIFASETWFLSDFDSPSLAQWFHKKLDEQ